MLKVQYSLSEYKYLNGFSCRSSDVGSLIAFFAHDHVKLHFLTIANWSHIFAENTVNVNFHCNINISTTTAFLEFPIINSLVVPWIVLGDGRLVNEDVLLSVMAVNEAIAALNVEPFYSSGYLGGWDENCIREIWSFHGELEIYLWNC